MGEAAVYLFTQLLEQKNESCILIQFLCVSVEKPASVALLEKKVICNFKSTRKVGTSSKIHVMYPEKLMKCLGLPQN